MADFRSVCACFATGPGSYMCNRTCCPPFSCFATGTRWIGSQHPCHRPAAPWLEALGCVGFRLRIRPCSSMGSTITSNSIPMRNALTTHRIHAAVTEWKTIMGPSDPYSGSDGCRNGVNGGQVPLQQNAVAL